MFGSSVLGVFKWVRPVLRIARALEEHNRLYRLDLMDRGVNVDFRPGTRDEVEVSYGPKKAEEEEDWLG